MSARIAGRIIKTKNILLAYLVVMPLTFTEICVAGKDYDKFKATVFDKAIQAFEDGLTNYILTPNWLLRAEK